jgi:hypothetical protein
MRNAFCVIFIYLYVFKKQTNETSMIRLTQTRIKIHHASSIRTIKNKLFTDETSMIHLTQTRMKIHHASSIRPI